MKSIRDTSAGKDRETNRYLDSVLLAIVCLACAFACSNSPTDPSADVQQGEVGCSRPELCQGMVLVPAGKVRVGCDDPGREPCTSVEQPMHFPTLSAFYIDETEVTQAAYAECVDAAVCAAPACNASPWCLWSPEQTPDRPVACIGWAQAIAYCQWRGKRLPTEAEWERAARGTKPLAYHSRLYPWSPSDGTYGEMKGADINCGRAVYHDPRHGCGGSGSQPVCSRSPAGDTDTGLCDMAGNVSEWVSDWFHPDYYQCSSDLDPQGPSAGLFKVVRGGSHRDVSLDVGNPFLNHSRSWAPPDCTCDCPIGIRCALSAEVAQPNRPGSRE